MGDKGSLHRELNKERRPNKERRGPKNGRSLLVSTLQREPSQGACFDLTTDIIEKDRTNPTKEDEKRVSSVLIPIAWNPQGNDSKRYPQNDRFACREVVDPYRLESK